MKKTNAQSGGDGGASGGVGNGILGSGIFGLFGSIVNCDAESDSIYCSIMKMFNVLMVIGIVCLFIYLIYNAFRGTRQAGGSRGRFRQR